MWKIFKNKDNINTIILVIILLSVCYIFYNNIQTNSFNKRFYDDFTKMKQEEIDREKEFRDFVLERQAKRDSTIEAAISKIDSTYGDINKIRKERDDKLDEIDDFTSDELYRFFMERYGK